MAALPWALSEIIHRLLCVRIISWQGELCTMVRNDSAKEASVKAGLFPYRAHLIIRPGIVRIWKLHERPQPFNFHYAFLIMMKRSVKLLYFLKTMTIQNLVKLAMLHLIKK